MLHRYFQGPLRDDDNDAGGGSKTAVADDKGKDEVAALRKELADSRKLNEELRTSERHWADRAKANEAPLDEDEDETPPPANQDEDDEFDDPAALLEGLTKNGKVTLSKIIDRYVKKAGLITKAEAEALATGKSAEAVAKAEKRLQSDARLVRELGDEINDENSPLFKRTAEVFQEMVNSSPEIKKAPASVQAAMVRAAGKTAKALLKAEGTQETRRRPAATEDDEDETESERRARISAQEGGRGKGGSFESEDEIGPETLEVMRRMGIDKKRGMEILRKERTGKQRVS